MNKIILMVRLWLTLDTLPQDEQAGHKLPT